ncbi:hypothetical protein IU486_22525 [Streptomyces gardneri]|nr:hypothetical protein [Streptomyces gardneri]
MPSTIVILYQTRSRKVGVFARDADAEHTTDDNQPIRPTPARIRRKGDPMKPTSVERALGCTCVRVMCGDVDDRICGG